MLKVKVIVTILVTLVLFATARYFASFYSDPNLMAYIIITAVSLLPGELAVTFESTIRGMQKYKYLAMRSLFLFPVKLLISYVYLRMGYGIVALLWINVVMSVLEALFYFILLRGTLKFSFNLFQRLPAEVKKRVFTYNWQVACIVALDTIIWQRSEVMLLGWYHPGEQVAFYGLAYIIVERVMVFLPAVFSNVLMPVISEQYGRNDRAGMQRIFIHSTRYLAFISVPICMLMMVIGKPVLVLLYGASYAPVAFILNILLVSTVMRVVTSSSSSVQYGTENQRYILKWGVALAALTLALGFLLIPKYAAVGAALANSIVQVCGVFIGTLVACRLLHVRFPFGDVARITAAALCSLPPVFILLHWKLSIPVIMISLCAALPLYCVALTLFGAVTLADVAAARPLARLLPAWLARPYGSILTFLERQCRRTGTAVADSALSAGTEENIVQSTGREPMNP